MPRPDDERARLRRSDTPDQAARTALAQVIAAGQAMIDVCDSVGQPVAANYFSMGLDVLRAHLDLSTETDLPVAEVCQHGVPADLGQS